MISREAHETMRFAVAVLAAGTCACGFWRTIPDTRTADASATKCGSEVRAEECAGPAGEITPGDVLRLRNGSNERIVRVVHVAFPRLEGIEDASSGPQFVVLDLRRFDEVETYARGRGLAFSSIALGVTLAAIAGLAGGIAAAEIAAAGD
jgi:hypothetical protein